MSVPSALRSGTVVERAVAKSGPARGIDPLRPGLDAGTAEPRATPPPGPATPGAQHRRVRRIEIDVDHERLARARIYTPVAGANRTTEEFRQIKRAILQRVLQARAEGVANANLVMVTSTREGEGKTFVSLNLAFSLAAEKDCSVVLIDADPAKSSVADHLEIAAEVGLTDLLEQPHLRPGAALHATTVAGLSILPAGPQHPLSAELFASERMATLLRELCAAHPEAIIILDAPPVLAASEPSALARHVGQTVLVVEANRAARAAISEALSLIGICPQIGLVLNKAPFRFGAVRFGAYYKSYYDRRGKRSSAPRG